LPQEAVERDRREQTFTIDQMREERLSRRPFDAGDERAPRRDRKHVPNLDQAARIQHGEQREQHADDRRSDEQDAALVETIGKRTPEQRQRDVRHRGRCAE
jgi:hypothetical protein